MGGGGEERQGEEFTAQPGRQKVDLSARKAKAQA